MSQPDEPYDAQELYEMWRHFRDDENAVVILADFAQSTRKEAAELIKKFEVIYMARQHDYLWRGKNL